MSIEPNSYVIFTAQGHEMCLGLDTSSSPAHLVLRPYSTDEIPTLTWRTLAIPGSERLYLQHVATETCPHFDGGDNPIPMRALNPDDTESVLFLADARDDGYCAISNHNKRRVFDCKEASNQRGTPIIGYKPNGRNNQKWRFVPVGTLDRGPSLANDAHPKLSVDVGNNVAKWCYRAQDPNNNSQWRRLLPHRLLDVFSGVSPANLTLSVEITGIKNPTTDNPSITVFDFTSSEDIPGELVFNSNDLPTWTFSWNPSLAPNSSKPYSITAHWGQRSERVQLRRRRSDPTFTISRNG